MRTTICRPASSRISSGDTLPPDLHETHPIIAQHYFGLELREVREVFWDLARLGYRLPPERGVILIPGGQS